MKIKAKQLPEDCGVTNGKVYDVLDECEHFYTITDGYGVAAKIHRNNCEVVNGHPHADLIMKYAEIAQYDDKPWLHFEYKASTGKWVTKNESSPFYSDENYRLKPRTININGFEVPEPLRVVPEVGVRVYKVLTPYIEYESYIDGDDDRKMLKAGIIHLTREAAEKHLEALLSFTKE